jgi:hypothetical protein
MSNTELNEFILEKTFLDDPINDICNEYYYNYSLKTKGIHVSKHRNFSKLKTKKPLEWQNFEKLKILCESNNVDYKKYIPFALDEIIKIHKYVHLKYLLNPRYLALYNEHKQIAIQYKKINAYILLSFKKIMDLCIEKKFTTFSQFIKYLIKEQKLGHYIKCGVVSKYILSLIPNIKELLPYFDKESAHELELYIINKNDKLLNDAKTALEKFNNNEYIDIIKKFNNELNNYQKQNNNVL